MNPFQFPQGPLIRKHGPSGYLDYGSYRDWLRDEFVFRCIYCLSRETWDARPGSFVLDHLVPQSKDESLILDYENLVYACHSCNSTKLATTLPDPIKHLTNNSIQITEDGEYLGITIEAQTLIYELDLNREDRIEYRELVVRNCKNAYLLNDKKALHQLFGFPENLPDLSKLRPPKNSKPNGVHSSFFAQKLRGKLPEYY